MFWGMLVKNDFSRFTMFLFIDYKNIITHTISLITPFFSQIQVVQISTTFVETVAGEGGAMTDGQRDVQGKMTDGVRIVLM